MSEPLSTDTPTYLAARLALLALRASIGKDIPLEADRVSLDGAPATSVDAAARALASMPKPMVCDAEAESGVLSARRVVLDAADSHLQTMFRVTREDDAKRGGYMGWLTDLHGASEHSVLAVGRGEVLILPLSVVELWRSTYNIEGVNVVGDDVENPHAERPEYREARELGARALLRFSSPADEWGIAFMLPLIETATTEVRAELEKQLIEIARSIPSGVELEADVDPSSGDPDSPSRQLLLDTMREHNELTKTLANEMERFFAGCAVPPEVAAFIAACREQG